MYYNNKIMNFYGDSFHATAPGFSYTWTYEAVNPNRLVVSAPRINAELQKTYRMRQVTLVTFTTPATCELVPPGPIAKQWPRNCSEVDGAAIKAAFNDGEIGSMLLNGKRLGNLSAIEAIPNQAIVGFRAGQQSLLGDRIAGEIIWNAGSRDGVDGKVFKYCRTKSLTDCYIGRFGWIGDRVSLEDQVANAAFVEMNLSTTRGLQQAVRQQRRQDPVPHPLRASQLRSREQDVRRLEGQRRPDRAGRRPHGRVWPLGGQPHPLGVQGGPARGHRRREDLPPG